MDENKELNKENFKQELLKVTKENNQYLKSIKNNLQFIAWYLIITIAIGLYFYAKLFGRTGPFNGL